MRVDIEQDLWQQLLIEAHRLTDAQPLVIDGDSLWKAAQSSIAFKEQGVYAEQAKQISRSQPRWSGPDNHDRGCIDVGARRGDGMGGGLVLVLEMLLAFVLLALGVLFAFVLPCLHITPP